MGFSSFIILDETVPSTSMLSKFKTVCLAASCLTLTGYALSPAIAQESRMGGGLIGALFGEGEQPQPQMRGYARRSAGRSYQQAPAYIVEPYQEPQRLFVPFGEPRSYMRQPEAMEAARPAMDPRYEKQVVEYRGREGAGTIVVDTANKYLYLVQGEGRALRYGIGVGRPGFTWAGVKSITAKKEWPSWTPPKEMLVRRPDLPRFMEGGPENPLGARALYLGSSLYRIHGSNEPWTIGTNVSSGCIRMRNEDVIDLYQRVNVGTRVVVS